MKMLLLTRKIGKASAKFVTFFVSQSLARERRLISGFHWVSRKYVSVFAGDPGYMIAYIPAIFFSNLEPGRYRKPGGGEGVRLFFSLWEAERHAGFLHSNTYCCRLFLPRPLYIHTCKRFHPRDIYHHADRDQKHIHLHLRENQPRQQFAYWSKISILYNILRKYNT